MFGWSFFSDQLFGTISSAISFLFLCCFVLFFLHKIAELAERSPIITQNSSNPSSRKNLVVRPYQVLLLTCVLNCTAGTPTPRLCPVVQWSVHWALSRTTRVLVLALARRCALETCGKKKMRVPLLGLAKSIYYTVLLGNWLSKYIALNWYRDPFCEWNKPSQDCCALWKH